MNEDLPPIVVDCTGGQRYQDGTKVIYLRVPEWVVIEVGSQWSIAPYVPDSAGEWR